MKTIKQKSIKPKSIKPKSIKPQNIKQNNNKKTIRISGKLAGMLVKGQRALIYSGGKIYYTSHVTKIHEHTTELIRFETAAACYELTLLADPAASIRTLPLTGAA